MLDLINGTSSLSLDLSETDPDQESTTGMIALNARSTALTAFNTGELPAFTSEARRARYRGLLKVHFQHLATSTAINLLRVIAWLNEVPRSTTPLSHFARLAA